MERQPQLWDGPARVEILVDDSLLPAAVVLLPSEGGKPEGILILGGTSHRNRSPNTWQTELAVVKPGFVWATLRGRHHPSDPGGRGGGIHCLALCQGAMLAHRDTRRRTWRADTARLNGNVVDVQQDRHVEPIGWAPALVGLKEPRLVRGNLLGRKTKGSAPYDSPPERLPAEEVARLLLASQVVRSVTCTVHTSISGSEGPFSRAYCQTLPPVFVDETIRGLSIENAGTATLLPVPDKSVWNELEGSTALRLAAVALSELPQGELRDELLAWAREIQATEARVAPLCEHPELAMLRQVDPRAHELWRSSPENVLIPPPVETDQS
jgi:hypothetical protein